MGDPRKKRKKYATPPHPWNKARIDEEKELIKTYGLKNKKEIWKMVSLLRKFSSQAKKLTSSKNQAESSQFLGKVQNLGLMEKKGKIEDILTITLNDILERRLQTLVFKKKLARSISQARQFITHRHVTIGGNVITTPSYIVTKDEESKIGFGSLSALNDVGHPERSQEEKKKKPVKKRAKKNG